MILYKYMRADAAKAILSGRSIGFSNPHTFNDPFELTAAYPPQVDLPIPSFLDSVQTWAKQSIWSENHGVLCLTRNPLNPLMWAHYGDEHRGVVLGIDVEKSGFLDAQRCVVPAQYGNIIYTHTRPTHSMLPLKGIPILVGHTHHYPAGHEEKLQRTFLQKPACWAYEEEVRVVKCLSDRDNNGTNPSGTFKEIPADNKTLFCYELPEESIKEIYFGMRHPLLQSSSAVADVLQEYLELYPNLTAYGCRLSPTTWNIDSFDISKPLADQ